MRPFLSSSGHMAEPIRSAKRFPLFVRPPSKHSFHLFYMTHSIITSPFPLSPAFWAEKGTLPFLLIPQRSFSDCYFIFLRTAITPPAAAATARTPPAAPYTHTGVPSSTFWFDVGTSSSSIVVVSLSPDVSSSRS